VDLGSFDIARRDGAATITLRGEFDLSNVRQVEAATFDAIGEGARDLCLDVREVTFMDSSMLNFLVDLRRWLHKRGGEVRIQPNVGVSQLLELTGLGDLFDLVEDQED
jgi:anti-sigma B factor antagonist/stage II sporulation protein AA (anti-sigma F factor antagonist)